MFRSITQLLIVLSVACLCCLAHPGQVGIERMQIIVEEDVKITNTAYDHYLFKYMRQNLKSSNDVDSLVGTFKWKDCGNSTAEILQINGLAITPDPVKLPGNVGLKFDVEFKETVDAPLKMSLEVKKHEGPIWITIPCIDGIGSCTYDDLCETLSGATCPQPFDDHKIPCKCPFPKGHYSLPTSTFDLNVGEIPGGTYYAKAVLSYTSKPVTCVEMYLSVS